MHILNTLAHRIKLCSEEVDNRNRSNLVLFSRVLFYLLSLSLS